MTDHLEDFRAAMAAAGLTPPADLAPGRFCRFPGPGKRPGNKSGWCKLFADGRGGAFGDYASGLSETWQAHRDQPLSAADRAAFRREVAEAQAKAKAERQAAQDAAAKKAASTWKKAKPAAPKHPYLVKKGVAPHGLRQGGDGSLLVPLRNAAGHIRSLQRISATGEKRFHPGGQITGCYFSLGGRPADGGTLLTCEGFATGASLHEATGYPVVVAFNTGNLTPVARAMRKKFPAARLILAADDDAATIGNPGTSAATKAALAADGLLAVPDFGPERPEKVTDFNDLAAVAGLEAVKKCVEAASKPAPETTTAPSAGTHEKPSAPASPAAEEENVEWAGGVFRMTERGLYHTGLDKEGQPTQPVFVCSWFLVLGQTRSQQNTQWGVLLEIRDPDRVHHQVAVPQELLQNDRGTAVRQLLADHGLKITIGKSRDLLLAYLSCHPSKNRYLCVNQLGWRGSMFLHPARSISPGATTTEKLVLQMADTSHGCASAGTVKSWKQSVAALAAGNSRLVLSISLAFASPLLRVAGEALGGIHLYGGSSTGKSTAALTGASVFGPEGYLLSWRGTDAGLEGQLAMRSDFPQFIEEIGEADTRKLAALIYTLFNGRGKSRSTKSGTARPQQTWYTLALSTGEYTPAQVIAKAGMRPAAGLDIRLACVPADAGQGMGLFETIHAAENPAAFALQIKDAAAVNHGAVGLRWLELVVRDRLKLAGVLKREIDEFCRLEVPAGSSGQIYRVARRFGLFACAGELASKYGLTGWEPGEALAAARTCFGVWLERHGGTGDKETANLLNQVKNFLELHGSARFEYASSETGEQKVIGRAGFYDYDVDGVRQFMVFPTVYRNEMIEGFDPKAATRILLAHGWLVPGTDGRPNQKIRLPGVGPARVYVFSGKMWTDNPEPGGET
ncbi:DUF927 domain-containing protein [Desulfurivibrio alkaliphilus]|uniref:DUF927 domain-containing protein n=1 Tax=Desulfurivibrio alkaliphilus (strain DSM 19089 / UNIQEM U267 / AHT2) TaxID=589865 RepID=D6Z5I8_DESAT|nr:DUF927 domain-containing protein [Desulfurivibrio alkaliphilus]ADH86725.1 protein of unknown function DUF927 [Desulfurivibrio alkaliphilus AHT 2]